MNRGVAGTEVGRAACVERRFPASRASPVPRPPHARPTSRLRGLNFRIPRRRVQFTRPANAADELKAVSDLRGSASSHPRCRGSGLVRPCTPERNVLLRHPALIFMHDPTLSVDPRAPRLSEEQRRANPGSLANPSRTADMGDPGFQPKRAESATNNMACSWPKAVFRSPNFRSRSPFAAAVAGRGRERHFTKES